MLNESLSDRIKRLSGDDAKKITPADNQPSFKSTKLLEGDKSGLKFKSKREYFQELPKLTDQKLDRKD